MLEDVPEPSSFSSFSLQTFVEYDWSSACTLFDYVLLGFGRCVDSSLNANVSISNCMNSALKMETVCFSETVASTDESARRQNP
jgi:hypothetical protein